MSRPSPIQIIPAAAFEAAVQDQASKTEARLRIEDESRQRAKLIYESLNPNQKLVMLDDNPLVSVICGRRGGKTAGGSRVCGITGEAKPYSISLVISLTLKALKRNWWLGSPSGIPTMDREFKLGLTLNSTDLRWEHQNGSIGYLLGAESREMLEYIRGIEADLYIIDECKSFAPAILKELIDEILRPQAMSRGGRIILIGTPGSILLGDFYESTNTKATRPWKVKTGPGVKIEGQVEELNLPSLVPYGQEDPWGRRKRILWSFHKWRTIDNLAKPDQWELALEEKERNQWEDDHPSWLREYMGEWLPSSEGLVYKYQEQKDSDPSKCTWYPLRTDKNPTGLPPELGPWHIIMGLDFGFMNDTALVVGAWSEKSGQLRHVHAEKHPHMLPDELAPMVLSAIEKYGAPEIMFGDAANLGKMLVEGLAQRYGFPIEAAKKTEKNDHIELINSDFIRGRIRIIPGTDLEDQLQSVQWDLSKGALKELAKTGKLHEDPKCANDLTDAFLYMWRGAMHFFQRPIKEQAPAKGTVEWIHWYEAEALAKAQRALRLEDAKKNRFAGPGLDELKWGRHAPGIPAFMKERN